MNDSTPSLLQLITIHRHGARMPTKLIPSIKCPQFDLPFGELSPLGQQQLFDLGVSTRALYPSLPQKYHPDNFYFRATDENRALMSAESFVQGFFQGQYKSEPPSPSVPIHSESVPNDYVIQGRKSCKDAINKALKIPYSSQEYLQKVEETKGIMADFQREGNFSKSIALEDISDVSGPILSAKVHKFTSCVFANETLNEKAIELYSFVQSIEHRIEDSQLAQLTISTFINEALSHIRATMKATSFDYVMYSAHDGNLMALLQLFKYPWNGIVPFASLFAFEVYLKEGPHARPYNESEIGIKLFYRPFDQELGRLSNAESVDITPYACNNKDYCSLTDIQNLVMTDEKWKTECGLIPKPTPNPDPTPTSTPHVPIGYLVGMIILGVAVVGLGVALLLSLLARMKKERPSETYSPLKI